MTEFETAARDWSAEHSSFVESITPLVPSGVAIFSSVHHEVVRRALGMPLERNADDIDLLVPSGQFGRVTRHLRASVMVADVSFDTEAGEAVTMHAREAIASADGDEIQFMDPLGWMRVGSSRYDTRFTAAGVAARTIVETNEGLVPFAHPAETVGIYAILQRRGVKNDMRHTAALLLDGTVFTDTYTNERAQVVGWDDRVYRFVRRAGLLAVEMQQNQATTLALV